MMLLQKVICPSMILLSLGPIALTSTQQKTKKTENFFL